MDSLHPYAKQAPPDIEARYPPIWHGPGTSGECQSDVQNRLICAQPCRGTQ